MMQLTSVVAGGVLMAASAVAPAAAAEQAEADAAIDAFTQRMTDLGFVAPSVDDVDADDVDEDLDADDLVAGDLDDVDGDDLVSGDSDSVDAPDPIIDCLAAAGIALPDDPDAPMPGAIAEAESPELEFIPSDVTPSTDVFGTSLDAPESIAAAVTTVDESGVALMSQLIDWMGSKDAAECFEQSLASVLLETDGDDEFSVDFPPPEIEMTNSGDLGVGDRSARIDVSFSMTFVVQIDSELTMLYAQSGRTMVMVRHVTSAGAPTSGVDPVAELQAIVDDLAA